MQTVAAPPIADAPPPRGAGDGRAVASVSTDAAVSFPVAAVRWTRRHPDLICVLLLLLVGGGCGWRSRSGRRRCSSVETARPTCVPGYELARGLGFAPILKRPPLYPLFVAFSIVLMGEDPHGLAFLQHLLGLGTVVLTYWLARTAFVECRRTVRGPGGRAWSPGCWSRSTARSSSTSTT